MLKSEKKDLEKELQLLHDKIKQVTQNIAIKDAYKKQWGYHGAM